MDELGMEVTGTKERVQFLVVIKRGALDAMIGLYLRFSRGQVTFIRDGRYEGPAIALGRGWVFLSRV